MFQYGQPPLVGRPPDVVKSVVEPGDSSSGGKREGDRENRRRNQRPAGHGGSTNGMALVTHTVLDEGLFPCLRAGHVRDLVREGLRAANRVRRICGREGTRTASR